MHCFCSTLFTTSPTKVTGYTFDDIDPTDSTHYCYDWLLNSTAQNVIMIGTSLILALINVVICAIFGRISTLEKHHTQNAETLGQFQKITIM